MGKQRHLRAVRRSLRAVEQASLRIQRGAEYPIGEYRLGQAVVMAGVRNIPRGQRKQRMVVTAIDEEQGVITVDTVERYREQLARRA